MKIEIPAAVSDTVIEVSSSLRRDRDRESDAPIQHREKIFNFHQVANNVNASLDGGKK